MKELIKPTRVLCKRTLYSGEDHWWDHNASPPVRHPRENRMLIEGTWYDVVHNEHDQWDDDRKTFTVIDSQGNRHLHYMYTEEQKMSFPDHCDVYGPRDYEKWFYTPEELARLEAGTFKMSYKIKHDITVLPGKLHWVKNDGKWVVAFCRSKHSSQHGIHHWELFYPGIVFFKTDMELEAVGERVTSHDEQKRDKEMLDVYDELLDTLFPLVDAINKNDDVREYAPVEYHMQFVNEAVARYTKTSFRHLDEFFGEKMESGTPPLVTSAPHVDPVESYIESRIDEIDKLFDAGKIDKDEKRARINELSTMREKFYAR